MRQLAVYLFTAGSLYLFRVSSHPSSGVHKTVTTASGTSHTVKYKGFNYEMYINQIGTINSANYYKQPIWFVYIS